tara:strand:+ start:1203 stop:1985 length:783 start_codon:yes stop_codon:yes gene_type:complete
MTETLTYDPTPADAPELNKDEQNSLEVAEKLGAEEAKQYAGKFENAEDLEKAYIELQKKLGSGDSEDTEKAEPEAKEETEVEESPAVSLINSASEEYYNNDGKLSEETMAKFSEMSSQDLVQAYMEVQRNAIQDPYTSGGDLSEAEINQVHNSVGGEGNYKKMINWATDNLTENQLDAFNSVISNGNLDVVKIAVNGLKAEYENAVGYEGRMLTGKTAKAEDGFRSQAEVVAAMSDPRYEKDPAYRQDLYDKLERSNVKF